MRRTTVSGRVAAAVVAMALVGACGADDEADSALFGGDPGGPSTTTVVPEGDGTEIVPVDTATGDLDLPEGGDDDQATSSESAADGGAGAPAPTASPAPALPPSPDRPPPGPDEPGPVEVGGEVDPAEDAESTFGLDVDTAGFTRTRQSLESGVLPRPEEVRVEDLVNAVEGGYEPPAEPGLAVHVDGAVDPDDPSRHLLRVGVATRPITAEERRPSSLTFVVDTSGSMGEPGKLDLVQDSLALLVEQLRPTDTVAIVTYGSDARTVLEPTPASEQQRILAVVEDLDIEGSTNAEAGLRLGYRVAGSMFRPGGINRVVLASDGVANTGTVDPDLILDALAEDAELGIHMVGTGFGLLGYGDPFLEELTNAGDGFYAYVDDEREARRLFVDQLPATLEVQAEQARSQVTFDPAVVEGYRLLGYENRDIADEDFEDTAVDAGELGAGHTATALYDVVLRPGVDPGATVATASTIWVDPTTGADRRVDAAVTAGELAGEVETADPHLRLAAVAAELAEVLRGSPFATTDLDALAATAEAVAAELPDEPSAQELADLVAMASELA